MVRQLRMILTGLSALVFFCLQSSAQTPKSPPAQKLALSPPVPMISDPAPEGLRIREKGIFGNYFPGKGKGPRPGILLLGGSEGGLNGGEMAKAKALAREGFSVLQLCYFGCEGLPKKLVKVPLETFSRGLDWLKRQPGVDGGRIGILGGSKGSEAALLAAVRDKRVKAVVATQPSSVVWPGIAYTQDMHPGWTEDGKPIAYLPYANGPAVKDTIFAHYNRALAAIPQHPDAVIPVERIQARIMLVCGEADTLWPSCRMTDMIAARLKQYGRPAPVIWRYPNAGHGVFGLPIDKSSAHYAHLGGLGGTPEGIAAAHADNWPKAVAFLKKVLSS